MSETSGMNEMAMKLVKATLGEQAKELFNVEYVYPDDPDAGPVRYKFTSKPERFSEYTNERILSTAQRLIHMLSVKSQNNPQLITGGGFSKGLQFSLQVKVGTQMTSVWFVIESDPYGKLVLEIS